MSQQESSKSIISWTMGILIPAVVAAILISSIAWPISAVASIIMLTMIPIGLVLTAGLTGISITLINEVIFNKSSSVKNFVEIENPDNNPFYDFATSIPQADTIINTDDVTREQDAMAHSEADAEAPSEDADALTVYDADSSLRTGDDRGSDSGAGSVQGTVGDSAAPASASAPASGASGDSMAYWDRIQSGGLSSAVFSSVAREPSHAFGPGH